jgi:transcription antitermination factor NusG
VCYWAACKTAPQFEAVVAKRLVDMLGCVIYLPKARVILPRSRRPATQPLFPTYLFVNLDLSPPWQCIRRTPGVVSLLLTVNTPSRCSEAEILKLKAAEIGGLVQLAGPPSPSDQKFMEGQAVRIRYGAFDNREARYARPGKRNMSVVTVTLLNRIVAVQVPTHALAASA